MTDAAMMPTAPPNRHSCPSLTCRVVVGLCTWLPSIAFVVFWLPRGALLFDKLREKGELPALTRWMLDFGRLGVAGGITVGLGGIVVLAGVDVLAARRRVPTWVHWGWLTGVVFGGTLSCCVLVNAVHAVHFP